MQIQLNKICRVCSNRGEYDVFSVIPPYLHASPNEFLRWKKNINVLLEETTGLRVTPYDGLPDKICALCISYLKHASQFRSQVIDNAINLKAIQQIYSQYKDCNVNIEDCGADQNEKTMENFQENSLKPIIVTEDDLDFNISRTDEMNNFIKNTLNRRHGLNNDNNINGDKEKNLKINLSPITIANRSMSNRSDQKLNLQKDRNIEKIQNLTKILSSTMKNENELPRNYNCDDDDYENNYNDEYITVDDNDDSNYYKNDMKKSKQINLKTTMRTTTTTMTTTKRATATTNESPSINYFDYKEKIFIEDDIMMELNMIKNSNILINIPTKCKEHKCRACYRCFMTEDTFQDHLNVCIELKFLCLIEYYNCLLMIRRSKTISPHEFIRRMIFSLKKTNEWLNAINVNTENNRNSNTNNDNNEMSHNQQKQQNAIPNNKKNDNKFVVGLANEKHQILDINNRDILSDKILNNNVQSNFVNKSSHDFVEATSNADFVYNNKRNAVVDDNDPLLKLLRNKYKDPVIQDKSAISEKLYNQNKLQLELVNSINKKILNEIPECGEAEHGNSESDAVTIRQQRIINLFE